jgi:hypothetical protein
MLLIILNKNTKYDTFQFVTNVNKCEFLKTGTDCVVQTPGDIQHSFVQNSLGVTVYLVSHNVCKHGVKDLYK